MDSAARTLARQEAERPARHHLRRSCEHGSPADSGQRRICRRQGDGCRDQFGSPDAHIVERRNNLSAADRAGERAEHRPASHPRHRARGHQPLPLDYGRLQCRAGGPQHIRIPGADLFYGKLRCADVLSDAVSDRLRDARQSDGLSRHGRSVAAPHAPDARTGHSRIDAEPPRPLRRVQGRWRDQDSPG